MYKETTRKPIEIEADKERKNKHLRDCCIFIKYLAVKIKRRVHKHTYTTRQSYTYFPSTHTVLYNKNHTQNIIYEF